MKPITKCLLLATLVVGVAFASAQNVQVNSTNTSPLRLKIQLTDSWHQLKNTDGPATFYRLKSDSPLQVSWAEYRGKQLLRKVTPDELKNAASNFGQKQGFGDLIESSNGDCKFGHFGTATFRSVEHPHIQVWFVTDGTDNILVTYICSKVPEPIEVQETREIAKTVALSRETSDAPKK